MHESEMSSYPISVFGVQFARPISCTRSYTEKGKPLCMTVPKSLLLTPQLAADVAVMIEIFGNVTLQSELILDGPGRSEKLVNASISPLFIVRPSPPVNDCADDLILLGCKYFSIMASALSSKAPSHVRLELPYHNCCQFRIWLILNNDTS